MGNHGTHLNSSNPFNDPSPAVGRHPGPPALSGFRCHQLLLAGHVIRLPCLQVKTEKRYGIGNLVSALLYLVKEHQHSDTPAAGGDFYFERALSSFDIPQNIAFNMGYELPVGKGKRFL